MSKQQATKPKSFKFATGSSTEELKRSIGNHLKFSLARDPQTATKRDWWVALSLAARDRIVDKMIRTMAAHNEKNARRVYYFSLEYLMGRLLTNNLINLGVRDQAKEALQELGLDYDEICAEETDMGLGNGGLGRLAACFLDSLSTLDLPAVGYGIHYEFGLFRQEISHGYQIEHPDNWLRYDDPWEIVRPEYTQKVRLYGRVETRFDSYGRGRARWVGTKDVLGVPYDIPVCGYDTNTVNFLRLWESKASEEFDFQTFNAGGYVEAVREKTLGETISKVLYPNDQTESGKELRLVQQYFFVSCSLHDIIRRYRKRNEGWRDFPEKVTIQLNDTHPAVAIVELMRILIDEEHLSWEEGWAIVSRCFGYTNHTLLPEALEKWSVPLFEKVLPRHLQIIYEINRCHLEEVKEHWPEDVAKLQAMSLIEEGEPKMVRMAHLAVVGSHSVNGVAALHTELLKTKLLADFYEFCPKKFNNKTNGITPRRWLKGCNPRLSSLISEKIGPDWEKDLPRLRKLEKWAGDPAFQKQFMEIKHENKRDLSRVIRDLTGIEVDPRALFDVQIKRLHEYKRQHLNLLHILGLYRRLLQNPALDMVPRVFIFGAKAAPGYEMAKLIIKAINAAAEAINRDDRIGGKLKVVYLPDYGVSLAEKIIPAADLSEQISTAGKEASGTGNMKLALNGAVTIGTLDGANVEIQEEVGEENIFIFGLRVEEAEELRAAGYNPFDFYHRNAELQAVVDWLGSGYFTPGEDNVLAAIKSGLLEGRDPFLLLADYEAYCQAQMEVDRAFKDQKRWARMAILNTARVGKFSSDRTISQYAREIWKTKAVKVK